MENGKHVHIYTCTLLLEIFANLGVAIFHDTLISRNEHGAKISCNKVNW